MAQEFQSMLRTISSLSEFVASLPACKSSLSDIFQMPGLKCENNSETYEKSTNPKIENSLEQAFMFPPSL